MKTKKTKNSQLQKKRTKMQALRVTTQMTMMTMTCQTRNSTVKMNCLKRGSVGNKWRDRLKRMIEGLLSEGLARMCQSSKLLQLREGLAADVD